MEDNGIELVEPPKEGVVISYSRLSTFMECKTKYDLKYLQKKRYPGDEKLLFGSSVHRLLELINKEQLEGNGHFTIDQIGELAEIVIVELLETCKYTVSEEYSELDFWHKVVDLTWFWYQREDRLRPKKVESEFRIPLANPMNGEIVPGVAIWGFIDGIVTDSHLVEYKTAARRWEEGRAQREIQPKFYSLAMGVGELVKDATFTYEILTKTKTPEMQRIDLTLTYKDSMSAYRMCLAYVEMERFLREKGIYPPSRGLQCSWCEFMEHKDCLEVW